MPRISHGLEKRDQVWSLIEILIASYENESISAILLERLNIQYINWNFSDSDMQPSIEVRASLNALSDLSKTVLGGTVHNALFPEQIREYINGHLSDKFLGILEDKRTQRAGRGAEIWHFEIKLWSTDLDTNRQRFQSLWQKKKDSYRRSTDSKSKVLRSHNLLDLKDSSAESVHCLNLFNALQPYEEIVDRLLLLTETQVSRLSSRKMSEQQAQTVVINVLRKLSKSDAVITYVKRSNDSWHITSTTECPEDAVHSEILLDAVLPLLTQSQIFSKDSHGRILKFDSRLYILIPLSGGVYATSDEPEIACICDTKGDSVVLGEPFGEIVSTLLGLTPNELSKKSFVEARILDALKRSFNFISPDLYERRFNLFKVRLNRMTVNFQPILKLKPLVLEGWEALARDPETMVDGDASTMTAPIDLFEVAELWGTEFTTELDLYFLREATEKYKALREEKKLNRYNEILPLSVNVYPSSLMRTSYLEAVKRLTDNTIPAEKLVLEISEKSELPEPPYWNDTPLTWHDFRGRLKQFVRDSPGVSFAIDDFGVGHASVSRLVGLHLQYVKIDREVLQYPEDVRNKVIEFVTETLIEAGHYSPHVIVEGVDKDYPISLQELLNIGAQSIQGYIVDRPQETIYRRLNDDKFNSLKKQLSLVSA